MDFIKGVIGFILGATALIGALALFYIWFAWMVEREEARTSEVRPNFAGQFVKIWCFEDATLDSVGVSCDDPVFNGYESYIGNREGLPVPPMVFFYFSVCNYNDEGMDGRVLNFEGECVPIKYQTYTANNGQVGDRFAPGNELFIAYRDSRFVNFTDSNRLELTGQDISFTHRVKSIISAFTLPGALIFIWAIGSLLGFLFYAGEKAEKGKSDDNAIAQSVFSILVWLSVSIFLVSLGGEETDRYNAGRASFIAQANNNLNIQETDTLGQFLPIGAGLQLRDTVPPVQHNSLTDIGIFFGMLGFVVGMLASLIAIAMGSKTLFVGALDTTIESEHKDGFKGVTDTKPFETGKTAITASVRTEVSKAKTRKHKAVTEELKAKAEINNAEIDIMKKEEELAIQKKELHLRKQRAEKEGKL